MVGWGAFAYVYLAAGGFAFIILRPWMRTPGTRTPCVQPSSKPWRLYWNEVVNVSELNENVHVHVARDLAMLVMMLGDE